mmetsp:Transcript_20939/g.66053  ORF Transcript_20939/g.66053 Transcript_20939/m.66053 type:complete len:240 (-) Transcript_20939:295-1014(-)
MWKSLCCSCVAARLGSCTARQSTPPCRRMRSHCRVSAAGTCRWPRWRRRSCGRNWPRETCCTSPGAPSTTRPTATPASPRCISPSPPSSARACLTSRARLLRSSWRRGGSLRSLCAVPCPGAPCPRVPRPTLRSVPRWPCSCGGLRTAWKRRQRLRPAPAAEGPAAASPRRWRSLARTSFSTACHRLPRGLRRSTSFRQRAASSSRTPPRSRWCRRPQPMAAVATCGYCTARATRERST